MIVSDNGIQYEVDPVTGIGRRLTPLAGNRALSRRPASMTRQFAPLIPPDERDWKALLSGIAADAWHSAQLVTLLAAEPADRSAAWTILARDFASTAETVRERIIDAYLELKRRMA